MSGRGDTAAPRSAMDTVGIRVYYDFASTLCYVAHCVLSEVEGQIHDIGVDLEWRPIDLTMAAPWDRGDSFNEQVRTTVRNTGLALGVDATMPDPWLDSRPASQVALATTSAGDESRWRGRVYDSIFREKQTGMTPELLELARELVGEANLPDPAKGFASVEESTRDAIALGVTGVPTLLLDNWLFGGIYDGESMVEVLRQLADQYREIGTGIVN